MSCKMDTNSPTMLDINDIFDSSTLGDYDDVVIERPTTRWERRHPGKKQPIKTHKRFKYY